MDSKIKTAVPNYIQHISLKFIILLTMALASGCDDSSAKHLKKLPIGIIEISAKEQLKTYLAITPEQQIKGLSGILEEEFSDNEAMLFTSDRDKPRQFWMPNTHFNLDVFFLSADLYVLDVHRSLAHFKSAGPDHKVPRSKIVKCRHVLEIKSSSPLAYKIHPGMLLNWKGTSPLSKIISNTHP